MKIQELAEAAGKAVEGGYQVQLIMPQRRQEYEHYYLAGRKSPKGRRINYTAKGEIVNFDAVDVLAWCIVQGARVNIVLPDGSKKTSDELLAEIQTT